VHRTDKKSVYRKVSEQSNAQERLNDDRVTNGCRRFSKDDDDRENNTSKKQYINPIEIGQQ
jgi:hypothetical protein